MEKNSNNYLPHPIDTSGVELPEKLISLVGLMAKNCHEVWSVTRMRQGWKYGPVRDDDKRQHPDLIPYEQLSEEEKEFDYNTSVSTLKLIMSLGFKIEKKENKTID